MLNDKLQSLLNKGYGSFIIIAVPVLILISLLVLILILMPTGRKNRNELRSIDSEIKVDRWKQQMIAESVRRNVQIEANKIKMENFKKMVNDIRGEFEGIKKQNELLIKVVGSYEKKNKNLQKMVDEYCENTKRNNRDITKIFKLYNMRTAVIAAIQRQQDVLIKSRDWLAEQQNGTAKFMVRLGEDVMIILRKLNMITPADLKEFVTKFRAMRMIIEERDRK